MLTTIAYGRVKLAPETWDSATVHYARDELQFISGALCKGWSRLASGSSLNSNKLTPYAKDCDYEPNHSPEDFLASPVGFSGNPTIDKSRTVYDPAPCNTVATNPCAVRDELTGNGFQLSVTGS